MNHTYAVVAIGAMNPRQKFAKQRAEGCMDTTIKILTVVVPNALLLADLYALFNDMVLPTLVRRVQKMFGYAG